MPTKQPLQQPTQRRRLFDFHPDVKATLAAHPDSFSPITSKSRMASLRYALAGWLYMLRYAKNLRIQIMITSLVFAVGLWLGLSPIVWSILIITITLNWMAEFSNTAIEAVVNLASPEIHPLARVAKDIAASVSLVTAMASAVIGGLLMGPLLLEKLVPILFQLFNSR